MLSQLAQGDSFPRQHQAKSIDFTPDITSSAYWDSHHIFAARITDIQTVGGIRTIFYTVATKISSGPIERDGTVKLLDLWFGRDVDAPTLNPNDSFILYYPKQGPSPIPATVLDLDGRRQLDALLYIGRLRASNHDPESMSRDVFHQDPLISLYCLKYLLKAPPSRANAAYVSRLTSLREDEGRDTRVRVLAGELVSRLLGLPENSDAEYSWLSAALSKSTSNEWADLRPFVSRLLEFSGKRTESVRLFTSLASAPETRMPIRIAAYSTFDDPRLFSFDHLDADSQKIFDACIRMLKDPEPLMRAAGAALLYNISAKVDASNRPKYVEQAEVAIRSASAVESDPVTRQQMSHYLKLLSN